MDEQAGRLLTASDGETAIWLVAVALMLAAYYWRVKN